MAKAIYNERGMAILTLKRALVLLVAACIVIPGIARAEDLATAEQQFAHKIAALTGPGAVSVMFENRSSLTAKEADVVRNALLMDLSQLGVHAVNADQAAATVAVTLAENPQSYVWAALITVGNTTSTALIATPRPEHAVSKSDTFAIALHKELLWEQPDAILDVAILQDHASSMEIAVLDAQAVVFYQQRGGQWLIEQKLPIEHARPWPRDLRGRLILQTDRSLQAFLPGIRCVTRKQSGLTLDCQNSDDPWPIGSAGATQSAFFAAKRNYFTGDVTPAIGKFAAVPRFYSAAAFARTNYTLWLFAGVDGLLHRVDGMNDQPFKQSGLGDLASVKTTCGSGDAMLLMSSSAAGDADSVTLYDLPDREPVPASMPVEFHGSITALWTGESGNAIAVMRNRDTGKYEAHRLQVACGQ